MPTERLSMRDIREILRQKWQLGRSHRQVAESVGVSAGAVGETMRRAKVVGVTSRGNGLLEGRRWLPERSISGDDAPRLVA